MPKRRQPPKRDKRTKAELRFDVQILEEDCKSLRSSLEAIHRDRDELIGKVSARTTALNECQAEASLLKVDNEILRANMALREKGIAEQDARIKKLESWIETLNRDKEALSRKGHGYKSSADALLRLCAATYTPPALVTTFMKWVDVGNSDTSQSDDYIKTSLAAAYYDITATAWHNAKASRD